MRIREPRAGHTAFLWLWGAMFGGIPLVILVAGPTGAERPPFWLWLFPLIAFVVVGATARRSLRSGFSLEDDGIHGAHDAESDVIPWGEVERIEWRWSRETSGVEVNGRPLPDGYALHAVLHDGRGVRLMQRVASRYGQQQDLNEAMVRAVHEGALRVPFDATIPTHDGGQWSGTPPPPRNHTAWDADDLPPAADSPLGGDDGPVWPTR
jgi:hypothetical protein